VRSGTISAAHRALAEVGSAVAIGKDPRAFGWERASGFRPDVAPLRASRDGWHVRSRTIWVVHPDVDRSSSSPGATLLGARWPNKGWRVTVRPHTFCGWRSCDCRISLTENLEVSCRAREERQNLRAEALGFRRVERSRVAATQNSIRARNRHYWPFCELRKVRVKRQRWGNTNRV
jgi:hypothetical protein